MNKELFRKLLHRFVNLPRIKNVKIYSAVRDKTERFEYTLVDYVHQTYMIY